MALIIKVGVSRKVSADYQSRGYTLDVQSEFDPRTLDDTNTLADATDHLFQLANQLLDQQVQKAGGETSPRPTQANGNGYRRPYGRSNGNGNHANGGGNGQQNSRNDNGPRTITQAQNRAVINMAKRLGVDPDAYADGNYEKPVSELTIREASDLIDLMKDEIDSQQAKGVAR